MCGGGPSSTEQQLQSEEADFYKTQIGAYNKAYSKFQGITDALNAQFAPILAGGPGQFGFTPGETAALRTQATQGTATSYNQAARAMAEQGAGMGGGRSTINATGGPMTQAREQLASAAAGQESTQQLGITAAGYQQGRENWQTAITGEENLAAGWNPNAFAGSATGAASPANQMAQTIVQQQQAPFQAIMGALGGAVGTAAGGWASGGFKMPS